MSFYSGVNWMEQPAGSDSRAQSRDVWGASRRIREKIWLKYPTRFFISLIGLLIALIITLCITSIAGSASR
ncbi:hypothetical protein KCP77_03150 [Salmonella enterica subsp. enterica]|nr:hypothetical protein KCP77_03150 [Salmonella enterica subsp. enterica]